MSYNNQFPGNPPAPPPPPSPVVIPESSVYVPQPPTPQTPPVVQQPITVDVNHTPTQTQAQPAPVGEEPGLEYGYEEEYQEVLASEVRVWRWIASAFIGAIVLGFVISPGGIGTLPKQIDGVTPPLAGFFGWLVSPVCVGLVLTISLLVFIHRRNHPAIARAALLLAGYTLALGFSLVFSAHAVCPT